MMADYNGWGAFCTVVPRHKEGTCRDVCARLAGASVPFQESVRPITAPSLPGGRIEPGWPDWAFPTAAKRGSGDPEEKYAIRTRRCTGRGKPGRMRSSRGTDRAHRAEEGHCRHAKADPGHHDRND
jgi:hypothetical protein